MRRDPLGPPTPTGRPARAPRVFYIAGPGAVVDDFGYWRAGAANPSEVAVTYSGQFYDICRRLGARAEVVSSHAEAKEVRDGGFRVEQRPKRLAGRRGAAYHLFEVRYSLGLIASALRFGADVVVVGGGYNHLYVYGLLRPFGVRLVSALHCTLWPKYRPPRGPKRWLMKLNGWFFRRSVAAVLCVSDDVAAQVRGLTGGRGPRVETFRPAFRPESFGGLPEPGPPSPFRVLYAGRVERDKGVDVLLELARRFAAAGRHDIEFDVCGTGSEQARLRREAEAAGFAARFRCHGHCDSGAMFRMFGAAHAVIVPTTSAFIEGFNKVVAEAVLAGRPVITSPVCPALEAVGAAAVEVPPDDVDAYAEAVRRLADDPDFYAEKRRACAAAVADLLDPERSFRAVLGRALEGLLGAAPTASAAHAEAAR